MDIQRDRAERDGRRGGAGWRRGLALAAGLLAALGALLSATAQPAGTPPAVSVQDARGLIEGARGGPALVLFYSSTCPACRQALPRFGQLVRSPEARGVTVLAFSTDESPAAAARYLADHDLPCSTFWLRPWAPGELSAALQPVGIPIGRSFAIPLLAVLDGRGKLIGSWTGDPGSEVLRAGLRAAQAAGGSRDAAVRPGPAAAPARRVVNGVEIL